MNKSELKLELNKLRINPNSYDLDGGLPSEKYCLENNYGLWSVYYSEKGNKTDLKEFHLEDDACRFLLSELIDDLTTRL